MKHQHLMRSQYINDLYMTMWHHVILSSILSHCIRCWVHHISYHLLSLRERWRQNNWATCMYWSGLCPPLFLLCTWVNLWRRVPHMSVISSHPTHLSSLSSYFFLLFPLLSHICTHTHAHTHTHTHAQCSSRMHTHTYIHTHTHTHTQCSSPPTFILVVSPYLVWSEAFCWR